MGIKDKDLLGLIIEMRDGIASQAGVNHLIDVSYKLALYKIKKNFHRIITLKNKWDLSVEDMAMEGVSNLFVTNSKREMMNIRCSLISWNEPIRDNKEAVSFLNKMVSSSVDQYINRMFREADPFFSKVLDGINFTIKHNHYKKQNYFGSVYIVKKFCGEIPGNIIGYEEFLKIPVNLKKTKKDLLCWYFDYLEQNTSFFPAIPLNTLIEKLLGHNRNSTDNVLIKAPSPFNRISTDDIIACSLTEITSKFQTSYIDKKKLTSEDAEIISAAMADIALDLREGNSIGSLPGYIKMYKDDLSKEEYRIVYQNIFEYLVKTFKHLIAKKLKEPD